LTDPKTLAIQKVSIKTLKTPKILFYSKINKKNEVKAEQCYTQIHMNACTYTDHE